MLFNTMFYNYSTAKLFLLLKAKYQGFFMEYISRLMSTVCEHQLRPDIETAVPAVH